MENEKFTVVGANIQEKAAMIWNVTDLLRGLFKPHECGLVIMPMTAVKCFLDCLLHTHKRMHRSYCSSKGAVNVNCLMMLKSPQVIDRVVTRELAIAKK